MIGIVPNLSAGKNSEGSGRKPEGFWKQFAMIRLFSSAFSSALKGEEKKRNEKTSGPERVPLTVSLVENLALLGKGAR